MVYYHTQAGLTEWPTPDALPWGAILFRAGHGRGPYGRPTASQGKRRYGGLPAVTKAFNNGSAHRSPHGSYLALLKIDQLTPASHLVRFLGPQLALLTEVNVKA